MGTSLTRAIWLRSTEPSSTTSSLDTVARKSEGFGEQTAKSDGVNKIHFYKDSSEDSVDILYEKLSYNIYICIYIQSDLTYTHTSVSYKFLD